MINIWEKHYSEGNQLNMYPYPEVVRFIKNSTKTFQKDELTGLDIGIGSGVHMGLLEHFGYTVTGIDFSPSSIDYAKNFFCSDSATLICGDLKDFNKHIYRKKFDVIVDRLSSTHTSKKIVKNIFCNPKKILNEFGKVHWSGFDDKNEHRLYAKNQDPDAFSEFSEGKFKNLEKACFFSEAEVVEIFKNYHISRLDRICVGDTKTGLEDSYWLFEGTYHE
jgi:cyclopropane fatty-acyl-phospholipid synthase-like methyltransferase